MTKHLHNRLEAVPSARPKRRPKGWTPERRARQAARIGEWAPWRRSTGPKTEAGKKRCAQNALRHGFHTAERREQRRRAGYVLGLAGKNVQRLQLMIRLRNSARHSWTDYKPSYAHLSGFGRAQLALGLWLLRSKGQSGVAAAARWAKAQTQIAARDSKAL